MNSYTIFFPQPLNNKLVAFGSIIKKKKSHRGLGFQCARNFIFLPRKIPKFANFHLPWQERSVDNP